MRFILPFNQQKFQQSLPMHTKYNSVSAASVAILICLLASGISKTNAVPTDSTGGGVVGMGDGITVMRTRLLQRALRDVATMTAASLVQEEPPKFDATSTETTLDQPQGQCLLDGVLMAGTNAICEEKVGCRFIHKTGHCCRDYKCDCQKDGKTYLNGDKLVDPETPCTVCFCKGGEISCSSVTCFYRGDCTPKYMPGVCCPAYNDCPVSISEPSMTANSTYTLPSTIYKQDQPASALNPNITIKEITKPSEIRITDDNKAKPIHQMLKPTSTTEASTTTTTSTTTPAPTQTTPTISTTMATASGETNNVESTKPKASPSADNNQRVASIPVGGVNNESLKLSASVAYPITEHSVASPATEYSVEDFDEIVMVKNGNGDEKPISVFGTQGLQRVESEAANDPSKVNIKREYLVTTEEVPLVSSSTMGTVDFEPSSELIYTNGEVLQSGTLGSFQQTSAELEPDTAGSDNIYHIIMTTDGPRAGSSTESFMAMRSTSSFMEDNYSPSYNDTHNNIKEQTIEAIPPPHSTSEAPNPQHVSTTQAIILTTSAEESTTKQSPTTYGPESSISVDSNKSTTEGLHHLEDEDIAIPMESNPAYPSLPEDDFSLRDVNFPLSETDDIAEVDIKDEPRSISTSYDSPKSTKHLDETSFNHMDGSGSGMLLDMEMSSTTADSGLSSSTIAAESLSKGPNTVELMYSVEDSSAETAISNSTDFQLEKIIRDAESENGSGDSLEIDTLESLMGSGSGSFEINASTTDKSRVKHREPTTARPTRKSMELDIDELNASGDGKSEPAEDPKLDVESLKLDETQNNGVANPETFSKADIIAVKTNSVQDKTIEETEEVQSGERIQRLFLQRI